MGEGGGAEEKGRPDTKPFRKSYDTSPSALSLFRFHLSSFLPETPDTQAKRCPINEGLISNSFLHIELFRDFDHWPLNGGGPLNRWPLDEGSTENRVGR